MKKLVTLLLIAPALALAIIVASCTKEGEQGPPGENGINGTDGTATCGQCHDSGEAFLAKVIQWEASTHATGGNFERNDKSCAPCHTSMGFREVIETHADTTAATVQNPTPPNCYTCHQIHETYEAADWALRTIEPVALRTDGTNTSMGQGNLCSNCHQINPPNPMPVVGATEDVTITSPYWGPHHGPQANMFTGNGGYEVGSGYGNSFHTANVESGCVQCHLADPYGVQAGGHTMNMTYAYHGHDVVNKAGCLECHADPDNLDTKIEETKADIDEKLDELKVLLMAMGVLDEGDHVVPGTMPSLSAGAVYNYLYVLEDRSGGTHNYAYAKKLLDNTIAAIQ